MKNLLITLVITLVIILSGCSSSWHLRQALNKDPEIIDVKADTIFEEKITYRDTLIRINKKDTIKIVSDTIKLDSIVFEKIKPSFEPIRISSDDSIAHALISMTDGKLKINVWAKMDTILAWKDSVILKNKIIQNKQTVIREKSAIIKEKKSFIDKLKTWAIIAGICIFGLIILVVKLK